MSQHRPVPRLDLAPKQKRPLSLWNPLDYLRLLYWVFCFPQALRWYVDTFGAGYIPLREMNWRNRWELLRQNRIERQMLLQGFVLIVVMPLALGVIFQGLGISFFWLWMAASGVLLTVPLSISLGMTWDVALAWGLGWALGVLLGMQLGVASGVRLGLASGVQLGVASGVRLGVLLGVVLGVVLGVPLGVVLDMELDDFATGEFFGVGRRAGRWA